MSTQLQNFYKATITRTWTATTGDFNVSVKPTTSSGWLVISANNTTLREIVYFSATGTNAYGDYVTISSVGDRGLGGTTAQTHTIGETIRMNITSLHWADMQADIDAIIAAGAPNASTTAKGLVEEATQAQISAGTAVGETGARLFINPSTAPVIETTAGATHSLTTVANQRVVVWAKGTLTEGAGNNTITLSYNGVTKDTVITNVAADGDKFAFSLMYTETPGAATANITVATSVGSISNVVIIAMKL